MTKSEKLAEKLMKPINTSAILLLGSYTVLWGLWVANPFWSVFTQAQLFSEMASIAPEVSWGILAILCGMATIYGVLRPSYRSLLTGAAVVGWHWTTIGILYLIGDWQNTGGITALTFGVYSAFVYLNIKVNKNRLGLSHKEASMMLKRKNY